MGREQQEVVGVDQPFFRVGAEEILGMADDELVEGRARRHEDADGSRPSTGAAELLPGRRDRAWVTNEHRALQAPDVDAELERVRAHDGGDLSVAKPRLYLSPMQRQITGAVAAYAARGVEARIEVLPQVAQHHLHREAAAAEDDRLHARANPGRRDPA